MAAARKSGCEVLSEREDSGRVTECASSTCVAGGLRCGRWLPGTGGPCAERVRREGTQGCKVQHIFGGDVVRGDYMRAIYRRSVAGCSGLRTLPSGSRRSELGMRASFARDGKGKITSWGRARLHQSVMLLAAAVESRAPGGVQDSTLKR